MAKVEERQIKKESRYKWLLNQILYKKESTKSNNKRRKLELLWIKEEYEEPVTLYLCLAEKKYE